MRQTRDEWRGSREWCARCERVTGHRVVRTGREDDARLGVMVRRRRKMCRVCGERVTTLELPLEVVRALE
jgi:transcriptional regulator NrdR family protein